MSRGFEIDRDWTLFLDRDGVINRRLEGRYVRSSDEFEFLPGVLDALVEFDKIFNKIVIVTNQQGIGKELMTHEDLGAVHEAMLTTIENYGGRIDAIYYCPHLDVYEPLCRKPAPGMALEAKKDFPEINFKQSIMVGDSITDVQFGNLLGMKTVYIHKENDAEADLLLYGLSELKQHLYF